jgi:tRNA-2-methylthio-N6-dimethylallyladenosine synthase
VDLRTYFVETWGCQMNVLDSQHLAGVLEARGLRAGASAAETDVVLLNTCSVRDKAVQKVLSRLGELRRAQEETGLPKVVGLCGCVAEQEGARLLARSRALSFVLGPGKFFQLPGLLEQVARGARPTATGFTESRDYDANLIARGDGPRQFVTAIHGCDQHCTFCIVPYTRGREASRPLREIVDEVRELAQGGTREVTLLGQTINAYRCPETDADLADLLREASAVDALWRLQFITSHPRFFTPKLIATMASLPRLGRYLHLPFQSGSTRVLQRMHRRYTREEYLALISEVRRAMPDVTLSTDAIVGFPGEEEEDFRATLTLVEEVRFGQLYGFVYSPRPKTPAAHYPGQVPRSVAGERLQRLFELQQAIQLELNQGRMGSTVEVLVDGPALRGELWQGRGDDNRVVNFPAWPGLEVGQVVELHLTGASAHALMGERALRPASQSLSLPS